MIAIDRKSKIKFKVSRKYTPKERFWIFTKKQSKNDCWPWLGSLVGDGRGKIRVNGKCTYAHRFSYETFVGNIPDGLQVLHTCDNPKCVNPNHLFVGTISDNMLDAYKKGRKTTVGEKNSRSILTEKQVLEIRKRYPIEGGKKLADEFGLERTVPYSIYNQRIWRHLT